MVIGKRILVVEDEYLIADDIRSALHRFGAEVIGPVATVDAALAALDEERIEAAVLDINVRGRTSFVVADALLARQTPFVFASGYDKHTIPPSYQHVAHWVKPFDAEELARVLPFLLQGPALPAPEVSGPVARSRQDPPRTTGDQLVP